MKNIPKILIQILNLLEKIIYKNFTLLLSSVYTSSFYVLLKYCLELFSVFFFLSNKLKTSWGQKLTYTSFSLFLNFSGMEGEGVSEFPKIFFFFVLAGYISSFVFYFHYLCKAGTHSSKDRIWYWSILTKFYISFYGTLNIQYVLAIVQTRSGWKKKKLWIELSWDLRFETFSREIRTTKDGFTRRQDDTIKWIFWKETFFLLQKEIVLIIMLYKVIEKLKIKHISNY